MIKRYLIKKSDIGKTSNIPAKVFCFECEHPYSIYPFVTLGIVLKQDVGKICKRIRGFWYVENQEQFENRINHLV